MLQEGQKEIRYWKVLTPFQATRATLLIERYEESTKKRYEMVNREERRRLILEQDVC